jgi:hypothetical protein
MDRLQQANPALAGQHSRGFSTPKKYNLTALPLRHRGGTAAKLASMLQQLKAPKLPFRELDLLVKAIGECRCAGLQRKLAETFLMQAVAWDEACSSGSGVGCSL